MHCSQVRLDDSNGRVSGAKMIGLRVSPLGKGAAGAGYGSRGPTIIV